MVRHRELEEEIGGRGLDRGKWRERLRCRELEGGGGRLRCRSAWRD